MQIWNKNTAKPQVWYRLPLEACVSSNGKPYSISLKKGTEHKLLVNFVGGGLSWNENSAAKPINISTMLRGKEGYYISHIPSWMMKFMHVGIFNEKDKRNPFRDWHILNIPYVSADFHIGNNDYTYSLNGEKRVLHHHGNKNAKASLELLTDFFPETPKALLVMGQSAGGFGCLAHAPAIADIYSDCENITVYAEGSHLRSPMWSSVVRDVWRVNPELTKYIKSDDLIVDLFHYAQDSMPDSTRFLHSNSVWDRALVKAMYTANYDKNELNTQGLQEFHESLKEITGQLKRELSNYSFYLTDYGKKKDGATPHIFVGTPKLFYTKMQDDTSIADWLYLATEGKVADVGASFIV